MLLTNPNAFAFGDAMSHGTGAGNKLHIPWVQESKVSKPTVICLTPMSCYSCILTSLLGLFLVTVIIRQGGREIYIKYIHRGPGDYARRWHLSPDRSHRLEAWTPYNSLMRFSEIVFMVEATWDFPRLLECMCYFRLQKPPKCTAMTSDSPLQIACAF